MFRVVVDGKETVRYVKVSYVKNMQTQNWNQAGCTVIFTEAENYMQPAVGTQIGDRWL